MIESMIPRDVAAMLPADFAKKVDLRFEWNPEDGRFEVSVDREKFEQVKHQLAVARNVGKVA